jgi:predicted membrane channel-forming protein YqfA (hemolysin III family)
LPQIVNMQQHELNNNCVHFFLQACMFMSTVYHTFSCHSRNVSEKCLSLDIAGITLSFLATYLSGVYFSFFCMPEWRDFYLITVGFIFTFAATIQLFPKFAHESYWWLRISIFVLWGVYGLVPTAHFIYLNGGWTVGIVPPIMQRITVMYGICTAAFVVYFFKMPERFFPGLVDIIGSSHQWWHVIIVLAFMHWHHSGIVMAAFRLEHGCAAPPSDQTIEKLKMWSF